MASLGQLRRFVFGISPEETTFARRGFRPTDPEVQKRLEHIGQTFVRGYHASLAVTKPETLAGRLGEVENEFRGFAFEGAAMGLALLDYLTPYRGTRWQAFLAGPGAAHAYMLHVGVGWAAARLPWARRNIQHHLQRFDPLLRWLVLDGYGFHEAFFHWPRHAEGQAVPKQLSGYGRRAFDQGLGRCLWFIEGADVRRIATRINVFSPQRHADLFGGIGLACAYAGGVDRHTIETLAAAAGRYRPELAQGAAFAAKARQRAGNPAPHTQLACDVLCGMSADAAAAATDECREDLPHHRTEPAYELWRQRVQQQKGVRNLFCGTPEGPFRQEVPRQKVPRQKVPDTFLPSARSPS